MNVNDETQTPGDDAPVKDTADTQTSEADVQTNTDAPEAATAQEAEVNATDTAEEKLYAGKYKSVEDLENAYKNAESKLGQTTSDKAELTRILNEAFTIPEAKATDTTSDPFEEDTPQPDDSIKRDMAVMKFLMGHQEADGEAMKKILTTDPMIAQITGHDAKLDYAYLKSQSIAAPKVIAEAKKTAQAETQAKTLEKTAAQVEDAKKAAPPDNDSLLEKATGNYSSSDRDAARKALIRKHLVNL